MKTDLALVQCPGWGRECPPHALACLSAYARREGFSVVGFDLNNEFYLRSASYRKMWDDKDYYSFWENRSRVCELIASNEPLISRFVEDILKSGAPVVGFSTHTTSFLISLELARRIKARAPERIVLFGGPQCSRAQAGRSFAEEACVDAVVVGEGETTLVDVLAGVRRGEGLVPGPGLIMRYRDQIVDGGDRPLLENMDALPIPDYSDFAENMRGGRYNAPERLDIFDSRGCVRTCHFCSEWQFWRKFRTMSGERMFAEVSEQVRRHPHVRHFYFIGSLLNGNIRVLEKFCDLILASNLKITWEGQAIVHAKMDDAMLRKMHAAGCRWLGFGIESGSERLRRAMNKNFTNDAAFKTLRAAKAAGIKAQINIMFGLPTETREDFEETKRFLVRVRPHVDSVLASQSFTVLDKGTEPQVRPENFGITGQEHHLYWTSNGGENNYAERFRRYEEFCRLALDLGFPEESGVLRRKPDKWQLLGEYFEHERDYVRALLCLRRSVLRESRNATILRRLSDCYLKAGRPEKAASYLREAEALKPQSARSDKEAVGA